MEFTEKHAELVGLHFGDGSFTVRTGTNRLRFQLRGDAHEDRAHYEDFIIPLCNELIGIPLFGRSLCTVFDRKLNSFGVCVESCRILGFFQALGIPIGEKHELPIPEWIKSNNEFSKAFVRGLFDTDGGIYYKKNNTAKSQLNTVGMLHICSTSKVLIYETSGILSRVGIKHYIKHGIKTNGERDYYKIEVYRPHHRSFLEAIGSHNPKHLTKFWVAEKFGFCPPRTTLEQRRQILKGDLSPLSFHSEGTVAVNRASLRFFGSN